MIIGITGHANIETPFDKAYEPEVYDREVYNRVYNDLVDFLEEEDPEIICCSGMARGVDELFALAAIELNRKLIICVPKSVSWHKNLKTHESRGRAQAISYSAILEYENLIEIHEVSATEDVFNVRNQKIVDVSDRVYSYHLFESRGTMDCIRRAEAESKYVGNLFSGDKTL